ncbi:putative Core 1 udp-galactose:n-acetylgalactosamine-alpha-r beta 1 3-galactosyltransferase [Fasciola hepatica]|uniref:Core 1 udp-galactose:n-acetylgalactosamine-alpha-r beta 1 3-galactosyltransferase n=1 Tax=Fasciola hepatica TaxID=6192 RepID=A0A4E0RJA3_FASHE|nr:putative Core 1 udp-galactose:n-acetylgalactosamine-alpha-r beta 1 3-galactosyltransferase [Fasciola hepatica]
MSELFQLKNVVSGLQSDDIFRTSHGVGHHWRPGYFFPDSETFSKLSSKYTCSYGKGDIIKPGDHFETTTGREFQPKILPEALRVERNPPPPKHWETNYFDDFRTRFLSGGCRRPLSPSHQISETHEEFQEKPEHKEIWDPINIQRFVLENHHNDGPSKNIIASNSNKDLAGRIQYPKDHEVLRFLDPYMTTTMKDYRQWSPEELKDYPKKDIATYQELEGYPKAWGFGLKTNPIPEASVPREKPPMRDVMIFKEAAEHRRVLPVTYHVPHTGLKTIYQADYEQPSSLLSREDQLCPVETPFVLPDPDMRSTYATPMMYQTEYSAIGQCHRTLL